MGFLGRLFRHRSEPAATASAPGPRPGFQLEQTFHSLSDQAIFDGLVARLGFDSQHPSWTEALRRLHRHSRERRLQLVPDFFYTAVFSPAELPANVWEGTFPACGEFNLEKQRAFLHGTPSFKAELATLPFEAADETKFHWGNQQFGHADAALYYALIRRFRPRQIVEIGAGHSTKLAVGALADNQSGRIICVDPHAPRWLGALSGPIEILRRPVQEVPSSLFDGLGVDDFLFIDGSHICKTGSDVNHLFLRILPKLPPGVLVHIHDICLPFEYQRRWSEDVLCYWNEQYVLAALLANSTKFEILVGVYFLQRTDIDALRSFVPDVPGVFPGGGSLWMRSLESG